MTQPRGSFVWHELLTPNKESATAFYPRVVGWKTQAWDKVPSYLLWTGSRGPLGGLGTMSSSSSDAPADAPMGWLPFVGVEDAHRTVDQARSLGARIITDVSRTPAGGDWAVLEDPQGAVFAIYASAGDEGGDGSADGAPGEFSWHELGTTDYKAALDFYSPLFGWKLEEVHDMGEMGDYALFAAEGRQVGGMYNNPDHGGKALPPAWLCYVRVDALEPAVEAAVKAGGTVLMGPMDVPGGSRIAMLLDPDGMRFSLHQPPRAAAVAKASTRKPPKPASAKAKAPAAKPAEKPARKPARKAAKKASGATKKSAAGKSAAKPAAKKAAAKKSPAKKSAAKKPAKKAGTKKSALRRGAAKSGRPARSARRAGAAKRGKAAAKKAAKGKAAARAGSKGKSRVKSSARGRRGRR